jgi:hypothetical protein
MNDRTDDEQRCETTDPPVKEERREFLLGLGKWSQAVIGGVLLGGALTVPQPADAQWINRRGGGGWDGGWNNRGGSWVNRGGDGNWLNRGGWNNHGGSWVNRGSDWGGGSWVNRRGGWNNHGGGSWHNRGGGGWNNRGGSWINRR